MAEKNRTNEKMPAIAVRCDEMLKAQYRDAIGEIRDEVLSDRGQALGVGRSLIYAMRRIAAMSPAERTEFMRAARELEREALRARERSAKPLVGASHAQRPPTVVDVALDDRAAKADDHPAKVKATGSRPKRRK